MTVLHDGKSMASIMTVQFPVLLGRQTWRTKMAAFSSSLEVQVFIAGLVTQYLSHNTCHTILVTQYLREEIVERRTEDSIDGQIFVCYFIYLGANRSVDFFKAVLLVSQWLV